MTVVDAGAAEFEAARPKLMAIAYRMLGSVAEAEDVVGDVALRWAAADRDGVRTPEAWLVTVTTRRALDVLRSARLQRESYPGVWLPEPIATGDGPAEEVERIESLTMGFLVLLERLTPIERAVFVLHDALAYPYADDRRSRRSLGGGMPAGPATGPPPRHAAAAPDGRRAGRCRAGGRSASWPPAPAAMSTRWSPCWRPTSCSPATAAASSTRRCARSPGLLASARFLTNLAGRVGDDPLAVPCELNGEPGLVMHVTDGWLAMSAQIAGGQVERIWLVVNPAKLERLVAALPDAAGRPGPWSTPGRFRHRGGRPVIRPG